MKCWASQRFCYCSLLISKGEYRVCLQNSVFIELLKGQVIQRKHSKEHCFTLTYVAAHTFLFIQIYRKRFVFVFHWLLNKIWCFILTFIEKKSHGFLLSNTLVLWKRLKDFLTPRHTCTSRLNPTASPCITFSKSNKLSKI